MGGAMENGGEQPDGGQRISLCPQEGQETRPRMVTVDQNAAERFMLAMEQCMGDIQEQKELVDRLMAGRNMELDVFRNDTVKKFNAIIEATTGLREKIDVAESYERYLEERVRNANLSHEVAVLERQLNKEKAEFSLFIADMGGTVDSRLSAMEAKVGELKSVDSMMEANLLRFREDMAREKKEFESAAERKLDEICSHMQAGAAGQFESLRMECGTMLREYTEKCRTHLDSVKKQSEDFLRKCGEENRRLVERVPAVRDGRYSVKDVSVYVLAALGIITLAVQVFL